MFYIFFLISLPLLVTSSKELDDFIRSIQDARDDLEWIKSAAHVDEKKRSKRNAVTDILASFHPDKEFSEDLESGDAWYNDFRAKECKFGRCPSISSKITKLARVAPPSLKKKKSQKRRKSQKEGNSGKQDPDYEDYERPHKHHRVNNEEKPEEKNRNSYYSEFVEHPQDQIEKTKNDLSHEANYKLSKFEQDAAGEKPITAGNHSKSINIEMEDMTGKEASSEVDKDILIQAEEKPKRSINSLMNKIKLKTSRNMMSRGLGASLPSDALVDNYSKRVTIDDVLNDKSHEDLMKQPDVDEHVISRRHLLSVDDYEFIEPKRVFYSESGASLKIPRSIDNEDIIVPPVGILQNMDNYGYDNVDLNRLKILNELPLETDSFDNIKDMEIKNEKINADLYNSPEFQKLDSFLKDQAGGGVARLEDGTKRHNKDNSDAASKNCTDCEKDQNKTTGKKKHHFFPKFGKFPFFSKKKNKEKPGDKTEQSVDDKTKEKQKDQGKGKEKDKPKEGEQKESEKEKTKEDKKAEEAKSKSTTTAKPVETPKPTPATTPAPVSVNNTTDKGKNINMKIHMSINATVKNPTDCKTLQNKIALMDYDYEDVADHFRDKRGIIFPALTAMMKRKADDNIRHTVQRSTEDVPLDELITGKLPARLVKTIYTLVKTTPDLSPIWPGLSKHNPNDSKKSKNFESIRTQENESQIQKSEFMLRQVMETINAIIEQQVRSRTCIPLKGEMKAFYEQILQSNEENLKASQHRQNTREMRNVYLDESNRHAIEKRSTKLSDAPRIRQKYSVVKKLLDQYHYLPGEDQEKVKDIKDALQMDLVYLRKLDMDEKQIKRKKRQAIKDTMGELNNAKVIAHQMKSASGSQAADFTPEFLKLMKTADVIRRYIPQNEESDFFDDYFYFL